MNTNKPDANCNLKLGGHPLRPLAIINATRPVICYKALRWGWYDMLFTLTQLLVCQLAGEVIARAFTLAVPGPVIGMGILLVTLLYLQSVPKNLESTAEAILSHLSLLFVPAGVGVVAHLTLLGNEWQAILGSLVGSTVVTVLVTGWVLQRLHRENRYES